MNFSFDDLRFCPMASNGDLLNPEWDAPERIPDLSYDGVVVGYHLSDATQRHDVIIVRTGDSYEQDKELAEEIILALQQFEASRDLQRRIGTLLEAHSRDFLQSTGGDLFERITTTLNYYRNLELDAQAGVQSWRSDMIIQLRAIALVAQMLGNAPTHRQKEVHLCGLIEIIEGAIKQLREHEFDYFRAGSHRPVDIFRSDYPVRELHRKLLDAEQEVEHLRGRLAGASIKEDSDPFANE